VAAVAYFRRIKFARRGCALADQFVIDRGIDGHSAFCAITLAGAAGHALRPIEQQRPKASMMIEAMMPRPGAAKGVVPKNGIGIAFWIDGVPGNADMVKVEVPSTIAAGTKRSAIAAARNNVCAMGTSTKKATIAPASTTASMAWRSPNVLVMKARRSRRNRCRPSACQTRRQAEITERTAPESARRCP
jgi:hypothetical protein